MLTGLIFATEDAEDRSDTLAATLPFGGMTLLEYQARLLIAAGAGHILVAVGRVTPSLLGAVSRISKRDIPVDIVRSAEEAAAKAHPLSNVLVVADGLVSTDVAVLAMADQVPDSLLVTRDDHVSAAVERIDAERCWAGMALIGADRLAELAAMPREYDFQSTLLRLCVQDGARPLALPMSAIRAGHGVERSADALAGRSNAVLAALANQRIGWADRYIFTPVTRFVLPWLVRKSVPDWSVLLSGIVSGLLALGLFGYGLPGWGAGAALISTACFSTGALLSWLRGDDRRARWQEGAIIGLAALALTMAAGVTVLEGAGWPVLALALGAIAVAAIAQRMPVRRRAWYGNAASYLLLFFPFALFGAIAPGVAAVLGYALATLAAAVENLRKGA
ncbi:hypothetical protein [Stakelama pacifica]|uniref:Uncharacterized protein n=1 Tax=Stakelama pacifica TaxID=517720 RepID=A0A4R6FZD6_9SPHN|nr:hypothetical protein [Stakelama pacifica]TDN86524.1 hypothetical protein EV664_10195 [Stakelama pacifica]GGO89903.1 hypothetical protein GCM10011329_00960 [Stakelama pacifica]